MEMKHGKTSNLSNNHIIISEVILLLDITNNEYREKRNKIYIYIKIPTASNTVFNRVFVFYFTLKRTRWRNANEKLDHYG